MLTNAHIDISIAASRGFSDLTQNWIRPSHSHSAPSLKISCKSVQPFSRNLANKETNKQTYIQRNKEVDWEQYPVPDSIGGGVKIKDHLFYYKKFDNVDVKWHYQWINYNRLIVAALVLHDNSTHSSGKIHSQSEGRWDIFHRQHSHLLGACSGSVHTVRSVVRVKTAGVYSDTVQCRCHSCWRCCSPCWQKSSCKLQTQKNHVSQPGFRKTRVF